MKNKSLTVVLCIIASSCASTLSVIPPETTYFAIDFTKFTKSGFLITPEKYTGGYESIGIVKYVLVPGARYTTVQRNSLSDGTTQEIKKWVVERITLSQGLDSLHSLAKNMGANAIINFSATTTQRNYQSVMNPITLEGYELSGFAIRRKD